MEMAQNCAQWRALVFVGLNLWVSLQEGFFINSD